MAARARAVDVLEPVYAHLRARDPILAEVMGSVGPCPAFQRRGDPFGSLCTAIVHQQVAGAAAQAIHGRFLALFPRKTPTPARLAKIHWRTLRKAGLSKQKRTYLVDLARRSLEGTVRLASLRDLPDEEVVAELTRVKGIGRWTAEMFLMFHLGRPDVFPADDYGIVSGMRALYGNPQATKKELEAIAESWRPHRTTACWYIWQYKDGKGKAEKAGKGKEEKAWKGKGGATST